MMTNEQIDAMQAGLEFKSSWMLMENENGEKYWQGHVVGDMDVTNLDAGKPLILDPKCFPKGFLVLCESLIFDNTVMPARMKGKQ